MCQGVEERVISELPITDRTDEVIHQKMVMCAGKMVLLDKLLPRLFAEGHKVLIFSQMVKVLNIIEDYIRWKGYLFERLDGSTRASDRHVAVERFCRPSLKRFIMLLSTKAGGLGLNLTSADTIIIFDSDWNPHNDIQAQARAHRIGQTKAVMVYRLLTRKTYEMHMFHRASLKLGLDRAVLAHARNEQEGDESGSTSVRDGLQVKAKEIDELLKRGAYDIFREDDTEQTEFVEADIDAIMQRSAHKISYEGVTTSAISNTLGGFAKATFVSADEKEDVDINDPDFWKKAVGLDEPAAQADNPFLENLPLQRKRKQTQVFGEQTVSDQKELDDMLKEELDEESTPVVVKEKAPKKKAAEPKPKEPKESKPWGPHSRDRVLRALLQFGFGRWAKIRKESGASQRSLADVEHFVRSFMMQCGLCAGETGSIKGDTEFVREAINAAQRVDGMVKRGEREPLKIPPILQNEKFVSKLKLAGRKMLQKLDLLAKLNSMVGESIAKVYAECPDIEQSPTLDEAVMDLPRDK
ncbi:CHD7, partial [Symbiodinium microadriaticum]